MNGYEYEAWCQKWLKSQGYKNIRLTPASHDQGIDILATRYHKTTGFQCKYYDHPVGNKAIQEAYTGAAYYHCDQAAVITNSVFTKSAVELAQDLNVGLLAGICDEHHSRFWKIHTCLSLLLLFFSTAWFLYCSAHSHLLLRKESIIAALLIFFTTVFSFSHSIPVLFSAILFSVYPLVFLALRRITIELLLFCLPLLLLDLMNLLTLFKELKIKLSNEGQEEKKEIRTSMNEQTKALGHKLEVLLRDELGCPVHLRTADIHQDDVTLFYQADKAIDNSLALLEYSLNQLADSENLSFQFEIKASGRFRFSLKFRNRV